MEPPFLARHRRIDHVLRSCADILDPSMKHTSVPSGNYSHDMLQHFNVYGLKPRVNS